MPASRPSAYWHFLPMMSEFVRAKIAVGGLVGPGQACQKQI